MKLECKFDAHNLLHGEMCECQSKLDNFVFSN